MKGEAGADTFVFTNKIGHETVVDFVIGTDALEFNARLWNGDLTATYLDSIAQVTTDGVVLDFGNDQSVALLGLTTTEGLWNDVVVV